MTTQLVPAQNTEGTAVLNITFNGESGYMSDVVEFDLGEDALRRIAAEAISAGTIPGIQQQAVTPTDFANFHLDRFAATASNPNRLYLRPKTPVG